MLIDRHAVVQSVAVTDAPGTTQAFQVENFAYGAITVPAAATGIEALTFYGSDSETGTFVAIYEEDPAARTTPAACTRNTDASRTLPIPVACFAFKWIKMVCDSSGDGTVIVHLKS